MISSQAVAKPNEPPTVGSIISDDHHLLHVTGLKARHGNETGLAYPGRHPLTDIAEQASAYLRSLEKPPSIKCLDFYFDKPVLNLP